jgi:tRNA threonylcarbamoyladenosine biosynthesis protein TsaB
MRLVLMDTCGEIGSLALVENGVVLRERTLPPRTASAQLTARLRAEMTAFGWSVHSLGGVGVVSGPGSFTGVRVGLAAAKGLCEVAGVPLATISRLELLLDAGRGEFYARSASHDEELLMTREELLDRSAEGRLLIAEEKLLAAFDGQNVVLVELTAASSLPLAEEALSQGGAAIDSADANYVRQARGLYAAGQTNAKASESK